MKYKKPTRLSDPGGDFSPEELNGILLKQDAELGWRDFDRIFQGKMPAGTYEEVGYYIPLVCSYIEKQRVRAKLMTCRGQPEQRLKHGFHRSEGGRIDGMVAVVFQGERRSRFAEKTMERGNDRINQAVLF